MVTPVTQIGVCGVSRNAAATLCKTRAHSSDLHLLKTWSPCPRISLPLQALELPMRVGVKQGIMQGVTVGTTNCVFLCSYALAFWCGSTRVRAGKYDGEGPCFISQPGRGSSWPKCDVS